MDKGKKLIPSTDLNNRETSPNEEKVRRIDGELTHEPVHDESLLTRVSAVVPKGPIELDDMLPGDDNITHLMMDCVEAVCDATPEIRHFIFTVLNPRFA